MLKTIPLFTIVSFLFSIVPVIAAPIVHPGDTIAVNVLNYAPVLDDSQGRFKGLNADSVVVAADGSVSIPVAGTFRVAGEDTRQIEKLIERRLSRYVRDPSVMVRLLQQSQLIFLTGVTSGALPFLPGETLSSALGQLREQVEKTFSQVLTSGDKSGGTFSRSDIDLRKIVLERDGQDSQPIDGEHLLRTGLSGPVMMPGDTLLLRSKPVRVNVSGQVSSPGPIYLYTDDTLEQAVLAAGGPLPTASTSDASLLRDGKEVTLALGSAALRQMPHDGDTIVVRAAPRVTVLGQVSTPGEVVLKNGATLLSALYIAGGPTKWANVRDVELVHNGERKSFDLTNLQHGDLSPNVALVDGDQVYVPEGHRIDASLFFQGLLSALRPL